MASTMGYIACTTCQEPVRPSDLHAHILLKHVPGAPPAPVKQPQSPPLASYSHYKYQSPTGSTAFSSYQQRQQQQQPIQTPEPKSTEFGSWQRVNPAVDQENRYNEDVRLLRGLRESNQMLSEKTISEITQRIVIRIYEHPLLKKEDRNECVSLVRVMQIYANLMFDVFTHIALCCNRDGRVMADLKHAQSTWKCWDSLKILVNHKQIKSELRQQYQSSGEQREHKCNFKQGGASEVPSDDLECISALLAMVLTSDDAEKKFYGCRDDDAQSLVDLLQALLDTRRITIHKHFKRVILKALIRLSRKSGRYPGGLALRALEQNSRERVGGGGFGDIYKGTVRDRPVAIKVLRPRSSEEELRNRLCGEVVVWRNTKHPNILPLYGVFEKDGEISIVSPWMERGTLKDYWRCFPEMDVFPLILDIAQGIEYLHNMTPTIVHGDIKGLNIFVSTSGRACLADFGLSAVNDVFLLPNETRQDGLTYRWAAPELFTSKDGRQPSGTTTMSDIYAFACVCFELYSGLDPFPLYTNQNAIRSAVLENQRSDRPENPMLDDNMWNFIQRCWRQESHKRPTASEIVAHLKRKRMVDELPLDEEWDLNFRDEITYPLAEHPFHFTI